MPYLDQTLINSQVCQLTWISIRTWVTIQLKMKTALSWALFNNAKVKMKTLWMLPGWGIMWEWGITWSSWRWKRDQAGPMYPQGASLESSSWIMRHKMMKTWSSRCIRGRPQGASLHSFLAAQTQTQHHSLHQHHPCTQQVENSKNTTPIIRVSTHRVFCCQPILILCFYIAYYIYIAYYSEWLLRRKKHFRSNW